MTPADQRPRARRLTVHGARVALFVTVIALVRLQHSRTVLNETRGWAAPLPVERLRGIFPGAASIDDEAEGWDGSSVLDASGRTLGYVVQTSPRCDRIIGFSGPTNVLVAFGRDDRIVATEILSSGDTRDHVKQVREEEAFLASFAGLTREEIGTRTEVDVVSGATLTSLAIQESVVERLSGKRRSLRFTGLLDSEDARGLFPSVVRVEQDVTHASLWHVQSESGRELGTILRTSPFADGIVGYQGPTETLVGFSSDGRIVGISLRESYDNEPYVTYVREDEHFLTLFNGLDLDQLASMDLEAAEVEGVSGATMTSMAVAEGLVRAARAHREARTLAARSDRTGVSFAIHDFGAAMTILAGLVIGLTSLRSNRVARVALRLLVIAYLGLTTGTLLSQAMLVGWAQNGIPWRSAPGLVLLTAAAFLVPLTSRRNIYCSHLCPHGAAQQLLRRRLPWRFRLGRRAARVLALLPALLLAWCVAVPMLDLPFSLIDIEPFDAWVFRVAGWATITIAIVGLVTSLFVPMAYCRYGCPTGALLNYGRFHPRSDRWTSRDWFVALLVGLAVGTLIV